MNPVDAHVGKQQEGHHAQEKAGPAWKHRGQVTFGVSDTQHFKKLPLQLTQRRVRDAVVQFAVPSDLREKQSHSGNADPGKWGHRISDFSPHLILKEEKIKKGMYCKNEEEK